MIISARNVAYLVVILGIMLSFVTSFVPHAPGAFKISWGLFFWSLLPYLAYLYITDMLDGVELMTPGVFVLVVDFYTELHLYAFPGTSTDNVIIAYLPLWLTVLVLPLGWAVGRQLTKKAGNHE